MTKPLAIIMTKGFCCGEIYIEPIIFREVKFMEDNKKSILAFIVLFLGLGFIVGGMVYSLWGPF